MYTLWSLLVARESPPGKELYFNHSEPKTTLPATPDAAAEALLSDLEPTSVDALLRIDVTELEKYDRPLGDYCRDVLGLDGRNEALVKACGYADANEAVALVVRLAWLKAIEQRNPR